MKNNTAFIGADQGTRRDSDFYPTPGNVVRSLLEVERFLPGDMWEPAAGDGSISKILEEKYKTISTELRQGDEVYGQSGIDFLKLDCPPNPDIRTIFTNPPFFFAEEFIAHAKKMEQVSTIVMLLKLSFLEGQRRKIMFSDKVFPLRKVYVFSKRVFFYAGQKQWTYCLCLVYLGSILFESTNGRVVMKTEYIFVEGFTGKEVTGKLAEGYDLYGPPMFLGYEEANDRKFPFYSQAMIRVKRELPGICLDCKYVSPKKTFCHSGVKQNSSKKICNCKIKAQS